MPTIKITTEQEVPGYEPEFWGYSVTRKNNTVSDAGYASKSNAVDAAKDAATKILESEGWSEQEIEESLEEALA